MSRKTVILVLVSAALTGAALGTTAAATAAPSTYFPKNSQGLSYGSAADVPLSDAPDLVLAIGDDGKTTGYVRKSDLLPAAPTSLAAAIAHEKAVESGLAPTVIPLLDLQGNKIGTYTISAGTVTTN